MRPLEIIHIEDSEEDVALFGRACQAAGLATDIHAVRDDSEAIAYLKVKGKGKFTDRNRNSLPDLIVLDLKMPVMDGFDFLRWLRREAEFSLLPVLVFTRSTNAEDKAKATKEGATGYFTKPADFETLVRFSESFREIVTNGDDKNERG